MCHPSPGSGRTSVTGTGEGPPDLLSTLALKAPSQSSVPSLCHNSYRVVWSSLLSLPGMQSVLDLESGFLFSSFS